MARILTLTNWYPPYSLGGYEIECRDVMTRLARRGHSVEVLCSNERATGATGAPGAPGEGPGNGTSPPVHRELRMYWRDGEPWRPAWPTRLAIERHNQASLARTLDRLQPDVVSVWHMGALSLSLLTAVIRRGIPVVYAICDDWLTYGIALDPWSRLWHRNGMTRSLSVPVARMLHTPTTVADLSSSGCFCFVSSVTRERTVADSLWHYPVSAVVPSGIDRTLYPTPSAVPDKPWNWELLYVGRLDPRKGTDTLLRALALLPQARLTVAGGGTRDERARLDALVGNLGLTGRVTFAEVPHEQIAGTYLSHDCVVFPSEWPEPFGMVPLEAMACGRPVVATGMGGSAEFLSGEGNCVLFTAGDAGALARAVERVAGDAALRADLRRGGFASADRFDIERTADAFERWHVAAAEGRLQEGSAIH